MATPDISIKIKNKKEVKKYLDSGLPNAVRFAVANTASRTVFLGLKKSEKQMDKDFILRNKLLVSSAPGKGALKFNRAIPHHDISKITASWGSPEKKGSADLGFLEDQEEGFTNTAAVPAAVSRTSKSIKKRVKKKNYFKNMQVMRSSRIGSSKAQTIGGKVRHMLKEAFKMGFGLPGSNQFFYLKDDEYAPRWEAGFFQFSRSSTPGSQYKFPNIRRLFYTGKKAEKRRRAKHWMERSKNKITQAEIEKLYNEEANKSFTKQLQKR